MSLLADHWWAVFIALVLAAILVAWLVLGRRKGVGTEAAASLRDLDGTQAARPTFARPDTPVPSPLATGASAATAEPAPVVEVPVVDTALSKEPKVEVPGTEEPLAGMAEPAPPPSSASAPTPAPQAAPSTPPISAPAVPDGDDLTRMKGLGPKLRERLAELGVTRFGQIAAWDDAEIDRIDVQLGRFAGRVRRDEWVEQARLLAAGDEDGYQARFGALG